MNKRFVALISTLGLAALAAIAAEPKCIYIANDDHTELGGGIRASRRALDRTLTRPNSMPHGLLNWYLRA
jgi:hypothetical protein